MKLSYVSCAKREFLASLAPCRMTVYKQSNEALHLVPW
jgi:hypothetical protein